MANATQQSGITRLTPREVKELLDRGETVVFLDDRNPQAWSQSREQLPGAIRVPAGEVARHLGEIPREVTVVTYCT